MEPEGSLPHSQVPATCPGPRHMFMFRNKASFYAEEMSAPRPTPKLEDHPFSAVRDCFNIFATTLHTEGRSSVRNLRTRHAVLTGTHLTRKWRYTTVFPIFVLLYFYSLLTSFNFHLRKLKTYRCSDLYIDIFKQTL